MLSCCSLDFSAAEMSFESMNIAADLLLLTQEFHFICLCLLFSFFTLNSAVQLFTLQNWVYQGC